MIVLLEGRTAIVTGAGGGLVPLHSSSPAAAPTSW